MHREWLRTPAERFGRFAVTVSLAVVSGYSTAYWLCDVTVGYRPALFAVGWGAGWGVIVGLINAARDAEVSYDDRACEIAEALRNLRRQQTEEYYKRGDLNPMPETIYASTTTTDGANSMRGRLDVEITRRMRTDLRNGRPLSTRGMEYVDKATWEELHRLGLVQYRNGKPNAGVELTQAGRDWARL